MATYSRIEDMKLVGGGLCFDFANTVGGRVPAESGRGKRAFAVVRDKLGGYADLVTWGRRVGLLMGTEARRLLRAGEGRPDEAAAARSAAGSSWTSAVTAAGSGAICRTAATWPRCAASAKGGRERSDAKRGSAADRWRFPSLGYEMPTALCRLTARRGH